MLSEEPILFQKTSGEIFLNVMKNKPVLLLLTFLDQHRDKICHLATLFFLIAGLAYSLHLGNETRFPDEKQYLLIAQNLATGNGYSLDGIEPTAIRPPVYPLFLALFIKIGAPITMLRYLNFIALALCVYLIRSILHLEKAHLGSGLSAILLVGYGVLFFTAGTLYPQTIFALTLLCIIRLALVNNFGYPHTILLGLLAALIILTHPTGVFIPPLVVIWLFFPRHYHIILKGSVAAIIAIACISIWSYRNYITFDRLIPLASHGGDTLYIGNNPNTSVSSWYEYFDDGHHIEVNKLPEAEQNRYYLNKTVEFWTEHTGDAIRLYLTKLLYHFNFRNNYAVRNETKPWRDIIMFVTYYPLLICLILRLLTARKVPLSRAESLLIAIYLISALFHAIFLPRIRFRLPYDVVLIAHIGIMYSIIRQRLDSKRLKE